MKPFAFALQFLSGSENERWGLFVDGMRLGSFSKRDAEERAFLINAAFESRLKKELKKFRKRAIDEAFDNCATLEVAERIARAIRALPLLEEEKP